MSGHCINFFELHLLDPLVCENACHIIAFALWSMVQKYENNKNHFLWHFCINRIDKLIQKIHSLPPINEHTKQSIEEYLLEHHLNFELEGGVVYVGTVKLKMACQHLDRYYKSGQRELLEPLYQQAQTVIEQSIKKITEYE